MKSTVAIFSSDTHPKLVNLTGKDIDRRDRLAGYSRCGYHFVIDRQGNVSEHRPDTSSCIHCDDLELSKSSIGICLIGGADEKNEPDDNFTLSQWYSLAALIRALGEKHNLTSVRSYTQAVTSERINQILWRPSND